MKRHLNEIIGLTTLFIMMIGCEQVNITDEKQQENQSVEITLENIDNFVTPEQAALFRKLGEKHDITFRFKNENDIGIPQINEELVDSLLNAEPWTFIPADTSYSIVENIDIDNTIQTRTTTRGATAYLGAARGHAGVECELYADLQWEQTSDPHAAYILPKCTSVWIKVIKEGPYGLVDYKDYEHSASFNSSKVILITYTGKVIGYTVEAGNIMGETAVYKFNEATHYHAIK